MIRRVVRCAVLLLLVGAAGSRADTARDFFNRGAERFTRSDNQQARTIVEAGLQDHPDDTALLALKALLEQQQQQQSSSGEEQQPQDQESEQDRQQQEQKDGSDSKQQDAAQQEQPEPEEESDQPKEAREMTKDEARLLLDAMKQQEQALRRKVAMDRLRSSIGQLPPVEKDW